MAKGAMVSCSRVLRNSAAELLRQRTREASKPEERGRITSGCRQCSGNHGAREAVVLLPRGSKVDGPAIALRRWC